MPSASRSSMKFTSMMEFRTTIPAPAMKPIIEVAVKKAWRRPCAGRMPTREKGIAAMMIKGGMNDWNQPTTNPYKSIYKDQDGGEGDPEIAKHSWSDMDFF